MEFKPLFEKGENDADFNKEFAFDSRDNLILSLFYSVSYYRLAMNIMDILKPCVNDLLK